MLFITLQNGCYKKGHEWQTIQHTTPSAKSAKKNKIWNKKKKKWKLPKVETISGDKQKAYL